MTSQTRIVVVKLKNLIGTAILVIVALLLLLFMVLAFTNRSKTVSAVPSGKYIAGVYSSSVIVNGNPVDICVTVDENNINSIEMQNVSESVTTMYPMLETSFGEMRDAVIANGSVQGITYSSENKYTATMLLKAIETALQKAAR